MPEFIRVHGYLVFDGDCRKAMTFYQKCFGGELSFQTLADSPSGKKIPASFRDRILHAELRSKDILLFATDMTPNEGMIWGNGTLLAVACKNNRQMLSFSRKLVSGVKKNQAENPALMIDQMIPVEDRFGKQWLLYTTKKEK